METEKNEKLENYVKGIAYTETYAIKGDMII